MSLKKLADNEILIPLLMRDKLLRHNELVATAYSRGYFEHRSRIITRIVRERDEEEKARLRLINKDLKDELEWTQIQIEGLKFHYFIKKRTDKKCIEFRTKIGIKTQIKLVVVEV